MEEKALQALDSLNALLEAQGQPYKLALLDPSRLKLSDKNARYMDKTTFDQLMSNIKRDGGLTSVPLCYNDGGVFSVLSGNHRVMAARAAGLEEILVMYVDRSMTRGEKIAIQLSHNAIVGKDDMVILKSLWEELEDIDQKLYAGLDSETLKELEKLEFTSIAEARPDFKVIVLAFFPEDAEMLKALYKDIELVFSGDENYILSRNTYDPAFALFADVKEKYAIVNNAAAGGMIFKLARGRLDELYPGRR